MLIGVDGYIPVKRFGEEKGLEMIKKAGFDGVDDSLLGDREVVLKGDVRESALQTKRLLDKYGLICNSYHFKGHRDLMPTACPGEHLYEIIQTLRGKANWYINNYQEPEGSD